MKSTLRFTMLCTCVFAVLGSACLNSTETDASGPDGGQQDVSFNDTRAGDVRRHDAVNDDVLCPSPSIDAGYYVDDRGFTIRVPQERSIPEDNGFDETCVGAVDYDYLCFLDFQETHAILYIQNTPLRVAWTPAWHMDFDVVGAWLKEDAAPFAIDARFDYGGHAFKSIRLEHHGYAIEYSHSSAGYGYRPCQPPDCVRIYTPGFGQLIEDGCTPERTLPNMCVRVEEDGTVPPLFDNFEVCPGDPHLDAG